jgi:cell division protein FtsN
MQKSEKFFIFSWKELLVLALVSITAMGFFFTLGLHYGKQLHTEVKGGETAIATLEGSSEVLPPKDTLEAGAHHVQDAAANAIQGATEKAIEDHGLKADHPKPVDLPEHKIGTAPGVKPAADGGRVQEQPKVELEHSKAGDHEPDLAAGPETPPSFAIQLGSYPNAKEAHKRIAVFAKRGLKTEVRTAMVGGETRFRVVMPGFASKKLAEQKGREMKSARKIENFVVIKSE